MADRERDRQMGDSSSSTVPAQEVRHDPDDPAARGSSASAHATQALLQLSALLGVLLVAGRASGVFWQSHRARPGAVYPDTRGGVPSAPLVGGRPVAVGTGPALVGQRSLGCVSATQRWDCVLGGRQYLEKQTGEEEPAGQERA